MQSRCPLAPRDVIPPYSVADGVRLCLSASALLRPLRTALRLYLRVAGFSLGAVLCFDQSLLSEMSRVAPQLLLRVTFCSRAACAVLVWNRNRQGRHGMLRR